MGWASGYIEQSKWGGTVPFQIGKDRGFINGWIGASPIDGRLLRVEP